MNLTPEERTVGQANFHEAVGSDLTRRGFLQTSVAAAVTPPIVMGAAYFGYDRSLPDPVRIGVIGTGDEGNVLIGAMNPQFVDVKAICEIRPYNVHRAMHGDWSSDNSLRVRPGLITRFDYSDETQARQHITVYEDYKQLLERDDIEAVVIALPLHLHAEVAIAAMESGKHVLTEKLMAYNVGQCKDMARVARRTGKILATGHQRHYSVLYDNAKHLIQWGLLGEVHHIRAQWHRGNLPHKDSWKQPLPGGEVTWDPKSKTKRSIDVIQDRLQRFRKELKDAEKKGDISKQEVLHKRFLQWQAWDADKGDWNVVDGLAGGRGPEDYGYQALTLSNGRTRTALEELCRWRLWQRTGGGLMAELGSHQLDAASIFISALKGDGSKVHPLTVHAIGGRHLFPLDRHAGDHVYCMFEFPGPGYDYEFDVGYHYADEVAQRGPGPELGGIPGYEQDTNKKIVVTYSSIMGNGFGGYGEVVMGTRGTLVLEKERDVMLYKGSSTSTYVTVKEDGEGATLDTTESGDQQAAAPSGQMAMGPPSRGYQEEIEHWAWCIRNPAPENMPRCKPEVALGDAVIALTATLAIHNSQKGGAGYVQFDPEWFNVDSDATPDGSRPEQPV